MAGFKPLGEIAGMRVKAKHSVPKKSGKTEYLEFSIDAVTGAKMGKHLKAGAWRQSRTLAYPGTVKVMFIRPVRKA
jgi:hypothetical protein